MENDTKEEQVNTFDQLKQEAKDLGISFSKNISEKALKERVDAFYEKSEKASPAPMVMTETTAESRQANAERHMRQIAREAEAAARKTRVVVIIDNDQRINNATTTCTANCSNAFFDLGTIILPLNEKVEVRQGHIDALLGVRIPHHVRSQADPTISETVMRPRYSVQNAE